MDSNDQNIDTVEYLIIGGGVAGLSVANRLVDLGVSPTVVDAGSYPAHKVCGEFFSFECHNILQQWHALPSSIIKSVTYHVDGHAYSFDLPVAARGMSRYTFDSVLHDRAVKRGARFFLNTTVNKLVYDPKDPFRYMVSHNNGKLLKAKKALYWDREGSEFAAGKIISKFEIHWI